MNLQKKKIIGSSVTIASLGLVMAFAISSFAWFRINKNVNGKGMKTQIFADINLVDFNFQLYKYDFDLKKGVGFTKQEDESSFDLSLNKFDNYIRERNVNNNNIIRLDATLPYSKASGEGDRVIYVNVECSKNDEGSNYNANVGDTRTRTHIDENGFKYRYNSKDYYCNNISNVIQFKCFVSEYTVGDARTVLTTSLDESTADSTYTTATEIFKNLENTEKTFVVGSEKDDNISVSSVNIPSTVSHFILYIEYNYNTDLIDSFMNNTEFFSGTDTSILGGNLLNVNKDIEVIRISSTSGD